MEKYGKKGLGTKIESTEKQVILKELGYAKGFNIKELGEAAGVSTRAIHRWDKDIANVPFRNVVSLAKALDMNVDELAELLLSDY